MNSLLQRQIRKYLSQELIDHPDINVFLDAIDRSYDNYDEQFLMLQRAMKISSDELFEANELLKKDTDRQQEIIAQLKNVVDNLRGNEKLDEVVAKEVKKESKKFIDLMSLKTQEIVEMNKQREKMLKELEYQNNELSEYAHMVSHDLKSPLRSIDALTAWLKEDYGEVIDDPGQQTIKLIRANVEKMDALVTGILEYSTLGKKEEVIYPVDLNLLVNEIIEYIDIPNHIEVRVKGELPVINGDKHRLQQLFQNLIVNAVAYNDKEKGWVEVGYLPGGDLFHFYVKDNGKGIEKDYFDKVFKAFFKLENTQQSIGIGLSIVKKIVEIYHGKIWVESEVNNGTTFNFLLKNK
ncbi:histidine kinase [Wenyingzhuangia fucanilytica]|uniref:histidine kinase n=1 Tax=Wenyingzhuangia fucanilytica TaxID=1790137 RepID=A0A1B1Y805_9FLAO|nr:ATP-binding protein [Wenyingzhuangia fucanilytica]ANW96910.1 histidine kinase [Wenyingzhuangia fucanilytica]